MSVEEVVGRLKAHEERLRGHNESLGGQLLLTQEEWSRRAGKSTSERGRSVSGNRGRVRSFTKNNSRGITRHNEAEDGGSSMLLCVP